jgi:hypothetical protein
VATAIGVQRYGTMLATKIWLFDLAQVVMLSFGTYCSIMMEISKTDGANCIASKPRIQSSARTISVVCLCFSQSTKRTSGWNLHCKILILQHNGWTQLGKFAFCLSLGFDIFGLLTTDRPGYVESLKKQKEHMLSRPRGIDDYGPRRSFRQPALVVDEGVEFGTREKRNERSWMCSSVCAARDLECSTFSGLARVGFRDGAAHEAQYNGLCCVATVSFHLVCLRESHSVIQQVFLVSVSFPMVDSPFLIHETTLCDARMPLAP